MRDEPAIANPTAKTDPRAALNFTVSFMRFVLLDWGGLILAGKRRKQADVELAPRESGPFAPFAGAICDSRRPGENGGPKRESARGKLDSKGSLKVLSRCFSRPSGPGASFRPSPQIPDPALRTIPMAALYDGERFLVEHYAPAVVPGLSLVDPKPLAAGTE
jgi:hypothetical protein